MVDFLSRDYDANSKRLFYSYRVGVDDVMPYEVGGIPNGLRWKLARSHLDKIMPTFDGKPAIVKPRSLANPLEREMFQVGNFVHTLPMPKVLNGAMQMPSKHDWAQYNEKYAIGRVKPYKNAHGEWRFRIEITDPVAKAKMLEGNNDQLYPPFVSAQVWLLPPFDTDWQNLQNVEGSHVAFVDRPAGGFERMKVLAKCHDNEQTCTIKLLNASQTKCGFCPGEALVKAASAAMSYSSHLAKNESSDTVMSYQESAKGSPVSYTTTGATGEQSRVRRIVKDPNYRRGSEVERPEDRRPGETGENPPNGEKPQGENPNGNEDEETQALRRELNEVRKDREERSKAAVSEMDKLKEELRNEILASKKDKARMRIEKFMDKAKGIFKTRKAWEDAIEDMMSKLPYDDTERLFQRLAELEEVWTARAESMMIRSRSASQQSPSSDSGMHTVPRALSASQSAGGSIQEAEAWLLEALKRGIN